MDTENYTLYQFDSCPFCARVRQFMQTANIEIPSKDILRDQQAYQELVSQGGSQQVPCLRIERGDKVQWLYESMDIITYLQRAFAA